MASHRLIQYLGKTYGLDVSEAIYDRLNEYYFVEGHALNDRPRLAKVVAETLETLLTIDEHPTTEQELLNFLNGNEGRTEILQALDTLQQLGIHSIPKFIIEGRTVVDGAAHTNVFVDIFRRIEKKGEIQNGPVFSNALGISRDMVERASHVGQENEAA